MTEYCAKCGKVKTVYITAPVNTTATFNPYAPTITLTTGAAPACGSMWLDFCGCKPAE